MNTISIGVNKIINKTLILINPIKTPSDIIMMFLKNRYEIRLITKPNKNRKSENFPTFLVNGSLYKFLIFLYKKKKAMTMPRELKIPSKEKELKTLDKCIEERA